MSKVNISVRAAASPAGDAGRERVAEFSAGGVGGLISVRAIRDDGPGAVAYRRARVIVEVYREDADVLVVSPSYLALEELLEIPEVEALLAAKAPSALERARKAVRL